VSGEVDLKKGKSRSIGVACYKVCVVIDSSTFLVYNVYVVADGIGILLKSYLV
jgi:hypothetical protein